jgi:hypothetical protein
MDQNQDAVTMKIGSFGNINPIQDPVITNDTSSMANQFDVTSASSDQDAVTSNAGDNCYVVHAHKFLIPYRKMEIFDVNSISTDQDAVTLKLSNTATSPIAEESVEETEVLIYDLNSKH